MLKIREPAVARTASAEHICQFLKLFWKNPESLIVISSDLNHFHNYEIVQEMDIETSEIIEHLQYETRGSTSTCGYVPARDLFPLTNKNNLQVNLGSSSNIAGSGDKNSVIRYGAYVIE